jgi:hypothetical protein
VCASGRAGQGRRLLDWDRKWRCGMIGGMTRDQMKEILDRVLTWPAERQADVAHMVEMMEAQDNRGLRLSDEQVAAHMG